jgi:cupin superfamily acireductone dioxygenase involved in methionine salvage
LVKAVTDLQTEADLMTSFEQQLSEIARKQGYTANEVLSLVKENEEILQKQKVIL